MNGVAPEPCDIPRDDHDGEVRFYVTGWKCDHHAPWAAKGLPRPAPGPRAIYTYRAAQAADDHHENGQTT
ncbi:hypothetical protein G3M58_36885 [Streptomyces sp. SID7499]|uniref:Uncharacterized protein n=1 Tax=Streptomyces sp. SID7499 TaxID=2706086 RepID=A0A6G3X3C2_9ACTN|nr:hypothetical protein [Streptomyces sp. SID7499]